MLKCIIVDDENLAIDVIKNYLNYVDNIELAGSFNNAVEANNFLNNNQVDLMFLDIDMPLLNGISFLKNIQNPPSVIFTTAYSEYAIESYEYKAVDYLLKPIALERFIKAINRLLETKQLLKPEVQLLDQKKEDITFIFVKYEKKMIKIMLQDILYIESLRNYVKIVTIEKDVVIYKSISEFEEKLSSLFFLRIHRSFIVAVNKIDEYSSSIVKIGKHQLSIGRNYKVQVQDFLKKYCGNNKLI